MRCHIGDQLQEEGPGQAARREILFQHNNRLSLCCFRCVCTLAIAKPIHSISNIQMSHCSYVPLTRTSCRRRSCSLEGTFVKRTENRNLAAVRFLGKTIFVPRFANFTKPLSGFFFFLFVESAFVFSYKTRVQLNTEGTSYVVWFGHCRFAREIYNISSMHSSEFKSIHCSYCNFIAACVVREI